MTDLTEEEFIQRLIDAGWTAQQAKDEYDRIMSEEDESGYDGP